MTFPAALLGTTVRVLRTAAGRRALQLALLVGGLFALGFLCGEQAHAADGTPVPAQAASAAPPVLAAPPVSAAPAVQTVRTATERAAAQVHSAGEQAVAPVRDVLSTVSRTVGTAVVQAVVDKPRASAPSLPLPDLGDVADPPVRLTPGPKSTVHGPQKRIGTAAPAPAKREQDQWPARAQVRTAVGAPAPVAQYGPQAAPVPQPVAHTFAHHTSALGVPGRPAPPGDPDGVLGKQAADGSSFRHGDAHAVTLDDRAPLWLAPGAAARVDAPRTRDRHRDIPVFPG
ncbi:hypothetical protein ABT187_24345 [Streptomyces sp. NPDC001817]|uniref:hypothetical protein n=1 Tax=Streptomyces sp. NPDC001817 TaxID=3154398 RepID=UPI0033333D05